MTANDDESDVLRNWRLAAWLVCALGAALRIAAYAENRSLWYDEAALALNIAGRGFVALVAPLDYLQTAPPLFLWAERAMVLLFGVNEPALRAVPLVAGIATAPLMWRVGSRILPAPAALVAVALVALSPSLVHYASEVKPYATDALVTLVILDRTAAVSSGRARPMSLMVAGFAAIVASTPAVFVLAGVVACLMAGAIQARDMALARRTATLAAAWAAMFIVLLATIFRPLLGETSPIGKFMHWYWAANFLTSSPPGVVVKLKALLWAALPNTFFGEAAFAGATTVMLGLASAGLLALVWTSQTPRALLYVVPVVSLMAASMLRRYPIAERLILFAAPLSALVIASSTLAVARLRARDPIALASAALTVAIIVVAGRGAVARVRSTLGQQESREFARVAAERHAAGVPVWISGGGEIAWRFYGAPRSRARATQQRATPSALGGSELAPGLLLGAWYTSPPERILTVADDTTAAAKPSPWSATEATRVRALSRPCSLLFFTHTQPGETVALLTSVTDLGGQVRESRRAPGAELHQVCFAAPLQ